MEGESEGSTEDNQLHVVAPGQDWDAKAFPMLFPDGKNHLMEKEETE